MMPNSIAFETGVRVGLGIFDSLQNKKVAETILMQAFDSPESSLTDEQNSLMADPDFHRGELEALRIRTEGV